MACSGERMGYQRDRETDRFNLVPLMLWFLWWCWLWVPLGTLGLVESWLQWEGGDQAAAIVFWMSVCRMSMLGVGCVF